MIKSFVHANRRLIDLNDAGIGVGQLVKILCSNLKQDADLLARSSDPNAEKRIQFWLGILHKLATSCQEVCSFAWEALTKWYVYARQEIYRWVEKILSIAVGLSHRRGQLKC